MPKRKFSNRKKEKETGIRHFLKKMLDISSHDSYIITNRQINIQQ